MKLWKSFNVVKCFAAELELSEKRWFIFNQKGFSETIQMQDCSLKPISVHATALFVDVI